MDIIPVKKKGRPRKIKTDEEIVEKVKKKRGRKKKEKTQEEQYAEIEKVKKKRGRKNIVNYYSTHEKIDLKNVVEKNILLKLNITEDKTNKTPLQAQDRIITDKNIENKIIDDNVLLVDFLKEWKTKTDILCWWCTHGFDNVPLSLPVYYDKNNSYRTHGIFCTFSCLLAYNNENNITCKSKINHLYYKLTGKITMNVQPASSRYVLKSFGGYVDIKDFRSNDYIYEMLKYPMYITRTFVKETKNNKGNNKENFVVSSNLQDSNNENIIKQPVKKNNFLSSFISCKPLS